MRKKHFFRFVFFLNLLVSISLCIASLSPFVDPKTTVLPAFFGLAFPVLFMFNAAFLVFWLASWHKYIFVSIAALLLSSPHIGNYIQFNSVSAPTGGEEIKLMSFNVRLFDLYNWSENKKTRDRIVEFLEKENPDVLCMQEFFNSNDKKYFNTLDTLQSSLGLSGVHTEYTKVLHNGKHQFGIATLTSYPIIGKGTYVFEEGSNNIGIYTDIEIEDDTLRVINVHLASVHLSSLERQISEHLEKDLQTEQWRDALHVVERLANAFRARSLQAEKIAVAIAESPYPVILAGDFNDTPVSYAYHVLAQDMEDAYKTKGRSLGNTYNGFFPSMRIDYILNGPDLDVAHFETRRVELSDHYPVIAWIRLKKD